MKKIYLFLAACFITTLLSAQVQITTTLLTDTNFENQDLSNGGLDIPMYVLIENTGTETANLKWEFKAINGEQCIDGWSLYACDNNNCYLPNVTTNITANGALNAPSVLEPGQSYEFALHVQPSSIAGCCEIGLYFSTAEAPNEIISVVEIPVMINDPECENVATSTDDLEALGLKVYPTITNDVVYIQNTTAAFKHVNIYSAAGSLLNKSNLNGELTEVSLSEYGAGMYYLEIVSEGISSVSRVFLF